MNRTSLFHVLQAVERRILTQPSHHFVILIFLLSRAVSLAVHFTFSRPIDDDALEAQIVINGLRFLRRCAISDRSWD